MNKTSKENPKRERVVKEEEETPKRDCLPFALLSSLIALSIGLQKAGFQQPI